MDYYKTLELEKGASKEDVKKAFRRLAHKYHPDKKGGDEKKFKEVSEAYAVLSDDKKRAEYDAYGRTFGGGAGAAGAQGGFGGFDFSQFGGMGGQGVEFDLGDMFGDIFGGGRAQQRTRRGRDISIDIELSFREAVFGVERKVLLTKMNTCEVCGGSGAKPGTDMVRCGTCNGEGQIHDVRQTMFGTFSTARVCHTCNGRGEMPKEKCGACAGEGVVRSQVEVPLAVPAGIKDGEMLRLSGAGEAVQGGVAGDLYVKVHVAEDSRYRIEGHNIVMPLHVKLSDALLGSTYTVETLDGEMSVKVLAGVDHRERLRVKGKGVPVRGSNTRGDLFFEVRIPLPSKLSKKAKKAVEVLRGEGV
jgi:molecular chaperone DnaJ